MADAREREGGMSRVAPLREFYRLLERLGSRGGGPRCLGECTGKMEWTWRGVYSFFEAGETRSDSGEGARVMRVLAQHRGTRTSGSNHRSPELGTGTVREWVGAGKGSGRG